MKKLKFALIGCGSIAKTHVKAFQTMKNAEIVAFCDIDKSRAEEKAKFYGSGEVYIDYEDVLNLKDLDAIDICTPNYLHSIISVVALEKGINVICEKPDAINLDEAIKMKKAAENSGKTLMVMRNNRYLPTSRYAKKYILKGNMGDIYVARCGWQRRRGIPGKGGWFTSKEKSGGGPLIDLGVHMIDLAIWLMGNPTPVSVSGCTYRKFADNPSANRASGGREIITDGTFDVEDLAIGFIRFDNDACLQFEVSWASNSENLRYVELRGEKSGLVWRTGEEDKFALLSDLNGEMVDIHPVGVENQGINAHAENLKHFADVLLNGTKPDFEPQQGINMIKILTAIYKSAQTGKEVVL